ncbi:SDR family NAD(P)-dependent oxidoreductase [Salinimicrobium soli]|uniref:SDR family NAD(P)-dependent oxidoreductase n=1 Tax=Salinimicrobium soli TaxID=1254399 RepID=UPI003AAB1C44
MKIFVTGGTGSIGAHLVKMLSARGYTVHALVRSMEKAAHINFPNVIPFLGDITDKASIDRALAGCEQVYHLSAYAKVWAKDSGTFYKVNVKGTVNVLQAALEQQVKKVVVTSTAGVLGPSINGVITEEKIRDVDFFNEYEGSKAMAESRIKDFVTTFDMNVVIVSPTRVYGPFIFGMPSSTTLLVDKYVNHNWWIYPGDSKKLGNYIYIEDAALGHILAMEKGRKGHTYLLGGENHDYVSFFEIMGEVSGVKRKMRKIPVWVQRTYAHVILKRAEWFNKEPMVTPKWVPKGEFDWEVSVDKAIKELGLPVTPLEEGLARTVDYVRNLSR